MYKEALLVAVTKVRLNVRKLLYYTDWDQEWSQEFPTQELTSSTEGLSQKCQNHAPFIISLFERWSKNNRNDWLETVYF